ncbi:MAG: XRE family transcriptional regulator [Spirochaetales bacterium]|jgi:Zn-dependent peptidase ImmA (M78 family)/DNA-binding XRE family transcriptional regulator|nr:XRE family transcriptional regulator [Spirochaetales bacterium]
MNRVFNSRMLVRARKSRGYTQTSLAKRAKITQGKVSKIEDDLSSPTDEDIRLFARTLEYPEEFFYQPDRIELATSTFFRKRARLPTKLFDQAEARRSILAAQVQELFKRIDRPESIIPRLDPEDYQGGAIEISHKIRDILGIPNGPLKDLSSRLERAGVVIIPFDFGTDKVDGCTSRLDDGSPLIFMNLNVPPDRSLRTLAHELGHIVMHNIPRDPAQEENEADEFASELLMPEDEIKRSFIPAKLETFARLKLKWGTSMSSLIMRARDVGAINDSVYKNLMMAMGRKGYRKNEPHSDRLPKITPRIIPQVIRLHRCSLDYTVEEMAKILFCKTEEYLEVFEDEPERPKLKLL